MSEQSLSDRQEDEVVALTSMLGEDFVDLRQKDPWRVPRPPEVTLRLRPTHDSKGELKEFCYAVMRVKEGENYPLEPPAVIKIEESKGLSDEKVAELTALLRSKANELKGEVMLSELNVSASHWLSEHNRPPAGSFHQEMQDRQREIKIKEEAKLAREEEENRKIRSKEMEAVREEVERKKEEIKEERLRWREEEKKRQMGETGEPSSQARPVLFTRKSRNSSSQSVSENGEPPNTSGVMTQEDISLTIRGEKVTLSKLSQLGGNSLGGKTFLATMSPGNKVVAVTEWIFRTLKGPGKKSSVKVDGQFHDLQTLTKHFSSIEQELSSLQKVSHVNVIQYQGLSTVCFKTHVKLYVMEDFVCGANLSFYLTENLEVAMDVLKYYSTGILEALNFMHGHNFVHRDLRDTSVFHDKSGVVRVGDFSIDKRVRDLMQPSTEEKFPVAIGRGGKKVDVYRLGLLLLSLALGEIAQDPSIPKNLPPELSDFLKKCLNKDERDRWSSAQLLDHRWIKDRIEKSPFRFKDSGRDASASIVSSPEPDDDDGIAVPFQTEGTGQSRLKNEFGFISQIGKGGFGEVMKVKNYLDGQVYAIKKIKLNQKNKQATKKLMREVKLLSRLNHENVVRYYTSWIEVTTITEDKNETETSMSEESFMTSSRPASRPRTPAKKMPMLMQALRLDEQGLPYSPIQKHHESKMEELSFSHSYLLFDDDGSDDDDDEDDDDWFGTSFMPDDEWTGAAGTEDNDESSMSGVVFESSSSEAKKDSTTSASVAESKDEKDEVQFVGETRKEVRIMYIQMEYCDKQTLRNAMDDGLYKDTPRVWRMFREIIEGLEHIHTQAMIHRDLKPVNIFLDSHDHVKIGDFGLATTSFMGASGMKNITLDVFDTNDSMDASDMTGQIGTALYIAPEINAGRRTTSYTQKVDIYSLGIIFFEMCYTPLSTGMERIKILSDLRRPEIILPKDCEERLTMQQVSIIQLMLNHDPSKRPNSQELLKSDYLPPPQVEEAGLREMIRHSLANTQSKAYHHVVESCLAQNMSLVQEISYDMEITRDATKPSAKKSLKKTLLSQEYVRRVAEQVFQRHGAVHVQMGSLLPKGKQKIYDKTQVVQVMTRGGGVVSLPYDLRVSFARFLARSQINSFKRYCIAPVFREFQIFGYHPKEQIECAFDIVTPNEGSLMPDAEILCVADELLRELPAFNDVQYFFRVNHTLLLKGILLNCGIPIELHPGVYSIMREGAGWSKVQRATHLINLGVAETTVTNFLNVLDHEGSPSQIGGILRHLVRKNNSAAFDMKKALSELESVIAHTKNMGVKCPVLVSPSLVYNPGHFSGLICQMVRKKKKGQEVIAAGGRYDTLLENFVEKLSVQNPPKDLSQSAVGISLSMDRLMAVVSADFESHFSSVDVFIYSPDTALSYVTREKSELASKFWSVGVKCIVVDVGYSVEEVTEVAVEHGASFLVIIRGTENGSVTKIRSLLIKDRFQEKRVPDTVDYIAKYLKCSESGSSSAGLASIGDTGQSTESAGSSQSQRNLTGADTKSQLAVQVNYNYKFMDKSKFSSISKKRLESTISSKITSSLHHLASNSIVEVLVLPLPKVALKSMAAFLEFEDESSFVRSVQTLIEKHSRYRKDLQRICDEIQTLKFEKEFSIFLLYSSEEHYFTTMLAV